jgi:hypothetical protein
LGAEAEAAGEEEEAAGGGGGFDEVATFHGLDWECRQVNTGLSSKKVQCIEVGESWMFRTRSGGDGL